MNAIQELAPRLPTKYLRDFFSEKEVPEQNWKLVDKARFVHHISNVSVVEHMVNCGTREAAAIRDTLVRIDFHNGDVNHYLKHLAGALING